jgi:hypothetical protein
VNQEVIIASPGSNGFETRSINMQDTSTNEFNINVNEMTHDGVFPQGTIVCLSTPDMVKFLSRYGKRKQYHELKRSVRQGTFMMLVLHGKKKK